MSNAADSIMLTILEAIIFMENTYYNLKYNLRVNLCINCYIYIRGYF